MGSEIERKHSLLYCPDCGKFWDQYGLDGTRDCDCGFEIDDMEFAPEWLLDKELERLTNKREAATLRSRVEKLEGLLRKSYDYAEWCSYCKRSINTQQSNHATDCELAAALRESEKPT